MNILYDGVAWVYCGSQWNKNSKPNAILKNEVNNNVNTVGNHHDDEQQQQKLLKNKSNETRVGIS